MIVSVCLSACFVTNKCQSSAYFLAPQFWAMQKQQKKEIISAELDNNGSVVMGVTDEQISDPAVSL